MFQYCTNVSVRHSPGVSLVCWEDRVPPSRIRRPSPWSDRDDRRQQPQGPLTPSTTSPSCQAPWRYHVVRSIRPANCSQFTSAPGGRRRTNPVILTGTVRVPCCYCCMVTGENYVMRRFIIYKVDDDEMDKTCCTHDKPDDIRNFGQKKCKNFIGSGYVLLLLSMYTYC